MSDIKEKLEMELKEVNHFCDTIGNAIKTELEKGIGNVDTNEMYKAVDIYKDLSEVKKNIIEGCYKTQIMEAMDESEYGKDYDEEGRIRYYPKRSERTGRYIKGYADSSYNMTPEMYNERPAAYYRDMDRAEGKMYYTEPNEGRSGRSRRMYMESKMMHNSNNPDDKQAKLRDLENYLGELQGDVTEMISGASAEEKAMLKTKMQMLMQKIN